LSFARNQGLDLASGDYVVFVDTDDWVDSHFIQDFVNNISLNTKRLVVQDLKEVFPQKTIRHVQGYNNELLQIPVDLSVLISNYRFTQGYAWNKFYNLSLIREHNIHFTEGPVMNEDELFFMDYIKHVEEIYFIAKDNYNYLQRSNSITSKLFTFPEGVKYLKGLISFLNYLTSVKNDSPEIKHYIKRRINHIFDYVLRASIYGNKYSKNERIHFLNTLYNQIEDKKKSLEANTFLKKIDYFLFKNKMFSVLDYLLRIKTKYN